MVSPHWRIITLPDGTAVMSAYGTYDPEYKGPLDIPEGTRVMAGVLRSSDQGETWGDPSVIMAKQDALPWEETALCLVGDKLLAHARTGGTTWCNTLPRTAVEHGRAPRR